MAATDQTYRHQKTLDIVFAISCLLMLVSIVWMFAQDYNREFKRVQRDFRDVDDAMTERAMLEKLPEKETVDAAVAAVAQARSELEQVKDKIGKEMKRLLGDKARYENKAQGIKADYDSLTSLYNIAVENRDAVPPDSPRRPALEAAVADRRKQVDAKGAALTHAQRSLDGTKKEIEKLQNTEQEIQVRDGQGGTQTKQLSQKKADAELSRAEDQLKKVAGEFSRFAKAVAQKRWKPGDTFRNLPVLDAFAAPTKIQQYTLNEYPIDYSFKYVTRYDRCTTCHLGMELPNFDKEALRKLKPENVPEGLQAKLDLAHQMLNDEEKNGTPLGFDPDDVPKKVVTLDLSDAQINEYCVHPRLELFVDANSPHPAEKFGCTSCHAGQGSATDFLLASHTPNSYAQKEEWIKQHDWQANHFWDYPMLPKRFVESTCLKCHHQVTDLVRQGNKLEAPKLIRGYNLVRESGCFGCHEIAGIKSGREVGPDLRLEPSPPLKAYTPAERVKMLSDPLNPPGTMRKVGPSLYRISEKANQQWVRRWILAPRDFRPTTKMPHFYGLSNNSPEVLPDDQKEFPNAEIAGVAYYLLSESKDYLKGTDKYRQALEARKKELESKKKESLLSDQENKQLEEITRRLELDHKPIPLSREIRDSEGKVVQLPAVPKEKKEQDGQLVRGRQLFSERGCLACHYHEGTTKSAADMPAVSSEAIFGPDLSRIAAKIAPEDGDADAKRRWLVQWILDPEIHHPRTRMPVLILTVNEAADVAAWLLSQEVKDWQPKELPEPTSDALASLARVFLLKAPGMTSLDAEEILQKEGETRRGLADDQIKNLPLDSDERMLASPLDDGKLKWYIGRKAITRYGCFGCHEIPGFSTAKPIGTPLNDWGKKDPERLAFEDIVPFVKEHYSSEGEGHDSEAEGEKKPPYDQFFLDSLEHNRREGFLHQKLVEPRSYDFNRIRTWDDRLRMPQFQFARDRFKPLEGETPEQTLAREQHDESEACEAVMTFILGLVAEPVPATYLNDPPPDRLAEVKGRQVLEKYNCAGCHYIRPGIYEFKDTPAVADALEGLYQTAKRGFASDHPFSDHNAWTGQPSTQPGRLTAYGMPEALEGENLPLRLTEALRFRTKDKELRDIPAGNSIAIGPEFIDPKEVISRTDPYGGTFTQLLVPYLKKKDSVLYGDYKNARAALPPPLLREGEKVQPSWLFQFLRDPQKLRPMTVLRMPRFNMSEDEAMTLVSYFAAVDRLNNPAEGLSYPYMAIPQRDEEYWRRATQTYVVRLGKQKAEERLKALRPTWEYMLQQQTDEAENNLQNAEAAVKTAKPEEKKDAEKLRDSLKLKLDQLKAQAQKKDFAELDKQWLERDAYAADAYRLLASYNTPCLSCHQIGNLPAKQAQGPPLDLTWERLRPEWTLRWIASPDRMLSYPTPMPQNFPRDQVDAKGNGSLYPEFVGTPREQLTAVRDILMIFPKVADMPVNRHYRPPVEGQGGNK